MALCRMEAKIISRSGGRSAVGSASYRTGKCAVAAVAYRMGAELKDERTGVVYDYTRKRGVMAAEIMLPEGAPEWMRDRGQLWNAVEKAEKRADAQLARDYVLTLPHELDAGQRRDLTRDFVRQQFVDKGLVADIAWHAPHGKGDERNHHAHVMVVMRRVDGNGFAATKERPPEGKHPAEHWKAELRSKREAWAQTGADALEKAGFDPAAERFRVGHLTLDKQRELAVARGDLAWAEVLDREAEPKQGPLATKIEQEGRESHAGNDRRGAQARNAEHARLKLEMAQLSAEIYDLEVERAKRRPAAMSDVKPPSIPAPEIEAAELRGAGSPGQLALTNAAARADQPGREQADRLVVQADELRQERQRAVERQRQIDAHVAEQQRIAEDERKRRAAQEAEAREGEIRDAQSRYARALGDHYDIRDPYGSLARASMAEYGSFKRDREELNRQIAAETDAARREVLELRRDIEAADYMSITSRRIASQSEIIVGRSNTDEAVRQREQAAKYEAEARELRRQYRERVAEQAAARDSEATKTGEPAWTGPASRQRGQRTSRGRTAGARQEQMEAEAEDAGLGNGTESRRRAQRGERGAGEADHDPARGPDLER